MTEWAEARTLAAEIGAQARQSPILLPLDRAAGCVLDGPLRSLVDLPPHAAAAMDGWVVAGEPPWRVGDPIDAGDAPGGVELALGTARPIGTGAPVPLGAVGVLRSEHGRVETDGDSALLVRSSAARRDEPRVREHIREAAEEAKEGESILRPGTVLTPVRLGMAAAAGYDGLTVIPRPEVQLLVTGDEVAEAGRPRTGLRRDAITPAFAGLVTGLGGAPGSARWVADGLDDVVSAIGASSSPVLVVTGGTAHGRRDYARAAASALGVRLVVDGVAMRPGGPTMIGVRPDGRPILFLPGNPLAALLVLVTLGGPLLAAAAGRELPGLAEVRLAEAFPATASRTRLVAHRRSPTGARLVPFQGAGMLRGLATADGIAIVPPGGGAEGSTVPSHPIPE